jgi:hypothetical protein
MHVGEFLFEIVATRGYAWVDSCRKGWLTLVLRLIPCDVMGPHLMTCYDR